MRTAGQIEDNAAKSNEAAIRR